MVEKHRTPNAEAQARWRNQHVRGIDGEKERLTLVLDVGTKARLQRIAGHYGYKSITALVEGWAVQTDSEVREEIAQKEKAEAIKDYTRKA
jgi:hypothetical protein